LMDVKHVAETRGWTLAEGIRANFRKRDFSRIDQLAAAAYPDLYAGGAVDDDGANGWIAFKAGVPTLISVMAQDLPTSVELVPHRGFSEKELVEVMEEIYFQVYDRDDIRTASGTYDLATGEIKIEAEPSDSSMGGNALQAMESEIASTLRSGSFEVSVTIGHGLVEGELRNHIRGGGHLRTSTGAHVCTTGFTVYNASNPNQRGVATAGHCAELGHSAYYYTGHADSCCNWLVVRQSYTLRSSSSGRNYGDQGWYSSSHNPVNSFFYNWNVTRTVTSQGTARPSIGTDICRFGAVSGADCGTVDVRNDCNQGYCQLVKMRMSRGASGQFANGDSGGPWYWGHTGYGITSAGTAVGWPNRNYGYYTPAALFSQGIGVILSR
jgi:streptogrisin C